MSQSPNRWLTAVRYTAARLLLWLGFWALLQFLTPVKGVLAVVLGLLISSAVSIIVLDRQRDVMSEGIGSFFGNINQKIANSAAAEDAWQDEIRESTSAPSQDGSASQAIDQNENAALFERNDQLGSGSTTGDNAHGLDSENKAE